MRLFIQGYIDWFCKNCNKKNEGHTVECAYCGYPRYRDE